ncbi:SPOR domain-containing protein [Aminipila luticellarii]|uniref:SPOR domain-containing protein n=1 Tax=Aminipila luticellarii TaxID=2507160 RepID=A0A410PV00_9FIRM|nr:SPOR domain-containing protein [Aminipila luticellarii]QAT42728.1 SPOR domain-containing protein [Aminipila luticellarii]
MMRLVRRRRRRNAFRQKTKVNFTAIIVIISIAVLLGYGTARFIIYPVFNSGDTNSDGANREGFKIEKFLSFFLNEDNPEDTKGKDSPNTTDQGIQQNTSGSGIVEDKLNVAPTEQTAAPATQNGYCIQFGSFTTKLSAESLVSELKTSGINAEIIEKDGAYKVVSQLFEQKEQAVATMNTLAGTKYFDAFITPR